MATQPDGKGTTLTSSVITVNKVTIKPVGLESTNPEGSDMTHLGNTLYQTRAPTGNVAVPNVTFTGQYDPSLTPTMNSNVQWTLTYPDAGVHTFWGWLSRWDPGELANDQSEATTVEGEITVSNRNGSGTETGPSYA